MERETTIYSSMDEPALPLVYTESGGKEINCLKGYLQDMGNAAARDSISVLPEDRALNIRIAEYGNTITGIRYRGERYLLLHPNYVGHPRKLCRGYGGIGRYIYKKEFGLPAGAGSDGLSGDKQHGRQQFPGICYYSGQLYSFYMGWSGRGDGGRTADNPSGV